MDQGQQAFFRLGVALLIGAMIGVERGWKEREADEGRRIAGVRTYALLGLFGGVSGWLTQHTGTLFLAASFLAVVGLLTAAHITEVKCGGDAGVTSLVAAMLTVGFGALAAFGDESLAIAAAVVTTFILGLKPTLHRWVAALGREELRAAIKLMLISAVLLPVLPDRGYGPWEALNPYEIWWMVVLIAAISFAGYFAFKIAGARRGAVVAGLCAGLASSTALTLHFARLARRSPSLSPALATGVLFACGTMLPRMLVVVGLIHPRLLPLLAPPTAVMAAVVYGCAVLYLRVPSGEKAQAPDALQNPLDIRSAVGFGLLLAVVMLAGKALKAWLGDAGIWALSAASGVADVDAITLSLARMSQGALALRVAALGIVIAAAVNSVVKAGIAAAVGGGPLGTRAGLPLAGGAVAGLVTAWLVIY